MFQATKLVDEVKNTAYREKLFELYYAPATNPVDATLKDQFLSSMLIHTRRNMREPTQMTETEGEQNVKTTPTGAQFYKVSGSTGKSNPGAPGHIREIVLDGMHNFAEAPMVCADQCKASDGESSGFDVTTQGGGASSATCVAFEVRADDKNANIHCILWSLVPVMENEGMVGVRGQYVMVEESSNLPQIALGLGAVAAGILAYRYFSKKPVEKAKRGIVKPAKVFAAAPVEAAPMAAPVEPAQQESSGYFPLFAPAPQVEVVPMMQQAPMMSAPSNVVPMTQGSMGMAYAPSYGGSYGGAMMGGGQMGGYGMVPMYGQ
jgi:hypothetical protein